MAHSTERTERRERNAAGSCAEIASHMVCHSTRYWQIQRSTRYDTAVYGQRKSHLDTNDKCPEENIPKELVETDFGVLGCHVLTTKGVARSCACYHTTASSDVAVYGVQGHRVAITHGQRAPHDQEPHRIPGRDPAPQPVSRHRM